MFKKPNSKGYTLIELIVLIVIIVSFIATVCFITFAVRGCIKVGKYIEKEGVKSIAEEVWEGKKDTISQNE